MSKGFFLLVAIAWGLLSFVCLLADIDDDFPHLMFMLGLGIYSTMKLIEERTA